MDIIRIINDNASQIVLAGAIIDFLITQEPQNSKHVVRSLIAVAAIKAGLCEVPEEEFVNYARIAYRHYNTK